jgi:hypothetical protein
MFRKFAFGAIVAMGSVALAAPDAKDDLSAAAKKLADSSNYSWKTTSEGGFGGNQEGKTEKGGPTLINLSFGDNQIQVATKGQKAAIKTEDGWKTAEELGGNDGGQPGPGTFIARMIQQFKAPGAQADEYCSKLKEVKKEDDAYTAELSGADAASLMPRFGRRGGGGGGNAQPPQMQNAKLSLKLWVKDGVLTKYTSHLTGTININGEDRDIDRTTTTEISDVGSTKVEIPDEARKKLE